MTSAGESTGSRERTAEAVNAALSDRGLLYREQLRAPLSYWFIGLLFGLSLAIIMLVISPWWSLAALVAGTALSGAAVLAYGRPVIEIRADGTLAAGSAVLPASALGGADALDPERSRALRTYEADPRAFLLLRSYIPTAVRVEVADPTDPTPYLYLSSRRPKQLAAAVNALQR
ncbi:DUF3093 domain-containing protein [Actinocrinis puniceicyclus]|uniref:DUF3093 domain-containing protein n=1 Tax=Actinocrinis puniceicyclus TaxID=977794 RepID=A0A8J7WKL2_9ACTN|nr:DUF3093 domain-containing protein [Actinocrinis puniceicyclus]MBS2964036.1 DUF3093 domain-containing protein [Actinocrinis puniceicyclus]